SGGSEGRRSDTPRRVRRSRHVARSNGGGPATYEIAGPDAFLGRQARAYSSISASIEVLRSSGANDARTAARARSVTPPVSRSSSRAAISYSWLSVVPNIDGSSEFTVIVTPASRNFAIACSSSLAPPPPPLLH